MSRWTSGATRRLPVHDTDDRRIGTVESTYPMDGSSPEFAIVRVGRFGRRVLVPFDRLELADDVLRVPFSRHQLEDAPWIDQARYLDDAVSQSRGYWSQILPEESSRLPRLPL